MKHLDVSQFKPLQNPLRSVVYNVEFSVQLLRACRSYFIFLFYSFSAFDFLAQKLIFDI